MVLYALGFRRSSWPLIHILLQNSVFHTFHPNSLQSSFYSARPLPAETSQCLLVYYSVIHFQSGILCPNIQNYKMFKILQQTRMINARYSVCTNTSNLTFERCWEVSVVLLIALKTSTCTFLGYMLNFLRPVAICFELFLGLKKCTVTLRQQRDTIPSMSILTLSIVHPYIVSVSIVCPSICLSSTVLYPGFFQGMAIFIKI